jgi:RNA polymerase sigma-19 factor, ECF subfamily
LRPVLIKGIFVLDALYREHHAWLQGWIRRKLGDRQRAADLAQDTFCRLLERDERIVPRTPRSYLATVARRLLIDDNRRRDIESAYLQSYAELHGDVDELTPHRVAEAAQLLDGILRVLARLPAAAREAFLLRRCDGLTHAEIASRMRISARTVKRHIALAYLRCLQS